MPVFFETLHSGDKPTEEKAKKLVEDLIDDKLKWSEIFDFEILSSLFTKPNKTMLLGMRKAFRSELETLKTKLSEGCTAEIEEVLTAKLMRIICMLPLANIKPNQTYKIPTKIDGKWQLEKYSVKEIELTASYGLERLVLTDKDRFFAYGLIPLSANSEVAPILILPDPKYPAQQGFLARTYAIFHHLASSYKACQSKLINYFSEVTKEYSDKKQIKVYASGHTARLALETAFDPNARDYIKEINLFDPSELCYSCLRNYEKEWDTSEEKNPQINIQNMLSRAKIGEICSDWQVKTNGIQDTSGPQKQYFYNLLRGTILGGTINILVVWPSKYLLIPLFRTIWNHLAELAVLSILGMVFYILPGLINTEIGMALAALTAAYFLYKIIEPVKILCGFNEKTGAQCHELDNKEIQEQIEDLEIRVDGCKTY